MYKEIEDKIRKTKEDLAKAKKLKFNAETVNLQRSFMVDVIMLESRLETLEEVQKVMIQDLVVSTPN